MRLPCMGLPKECSPLSRWKVVMVWAYRRHLPEMENEDNALQALPAGIAISAAPDGGDDSGILSPPCLILKKVDSQQDKKMYYLHTESQEKYFEDVIRLHKSGCSSRKIAKLLPVEKTTVSNWISIFVREKGQVMRVKRTEELVNPDGPRASEAPSKDEMEALRRRIKELESQLLQSEIKAEAYDEMIRVAESKFGIPIRKKAGAKQ